MASLNAAGAARDRRASGATPHSRNADAKDDRHRRSRDACWPAPRRATDARHRAGRPAETGRRVAFGACTAPLRSRDRRRPAAMRRRDAAAASGTFAYVADSVRTRSSESTPGFAARAAAVHSHALSSPTSRILIWPSPSTKMFSGFRSRCTMPRAWAASRPRAICVAMAMAFYGASGTAADQIAQHLAFGEFGDGVVHAVFATALHEVRYRVALVWCRLTAVWSRRSPAAPVLKLSADHAAITVLLGRHSRAPRIQS